MIAKEDERELSRRMGAVAAARLGQLAAAGFAAWYFVHADWGGVAVALLCAAVLQFTLPRHDPALEKRIRESLDGTDN